MERKLFVKVVLVSATSVVLTLLVIVGVAWAGNLFTVDKDGTVRLTVSDAGNVGIGTETPQSRLVVKGSGTTSATSALNVTASNGTSRMYVRDDGKVGIGTTNNLGTWGELRISSTGYQSLNIASDDASGVNIALAANATSEARLNVLSNHPFALYTNNTEKMRINASGNVGVGTTDPKTKLHVTGLPEYADNAAAIAAGLTAGAFYRTGDLLKVVH